MIDCVGSTNLREVQEVDLRRDDAAVRGPLGLDQNVRHMHGRQSRERGSLALGWKMMEGRGFNDSGRSQCESRFTTHFEQHADPDRDQTAQGGRRRDALDGDDRKHYLQREGGNSD